jgi:hypothetical protein
MTIVIITIVILKHTLGWFYAYETIIECHFVTIRHRRRVRSRMRNTKRTNQKYGLQDITERRRHGEQLWTMIR